MTHRYAVGETVLILADPRFSNRVGGPCRILSLLPFEGHEVQYRVKPEQERVERIISERDIRHETVGAPEIDEPVRAMSMRIPQRRASR